MSKRIPYTIARVKYNILAYLQKSELHSVANHLRAFLKPTTAIRRLRGNQDMTFHHWLPSFRNDVTVPQECVTCWDAASTAQTIWNRIQKAQGRQQRNIIKNYLKNYINQNKVMEDICTLAPVRQQNTNNRSASASKLKFHENLHA